jgi:hypothetical protein
MDVFETYILNVDGLSRGMKENPLPTVVIISFFRIVKQKLRYTVLSYPRAIDIVV